MLLLGKAISSRIFSQSISQLLPLSEPRRKIGMPFEQFFTLKRLFRISTTKILGATALQGKFDRRIMKNCKRIKIIRLLTLITNLLLKLLLFNQ